MHALRRRVGVVLSASAVLVLVSAASAGALPRSAKPPSLTGETLNATTVSAVFFDCFMPPSTFSFAGTASGPYSGTFIANGTISYSLAEGGDGQLVGPVTAFEEKFTIMSPNGAVTGRDRLTSDGTAQGFEAAGGCPLSINALATRYVGTIATAEGHHYRDRGTSSVSLVGLDFDGCQEVCSSSIDQTFASKR